jgi:hypothetical protein
MLFAFARRGADATERQCGHKERLCFVAQLSNGRPMPGQISTQKDLARSEQQRLLAPEDVHEHSGEPTDRFDYQCISVTASARTPRVLCRR